MSNKLEHELKKEFQLERMILFSDAIFAIAITLLVLEIKVPPIDRHIATDDMLLKSLDELMPKFVGFFISFFIIGLYWTIHHRMFGNVVNYNTRTLWLNLFFLFAVVLMPFSTAFYSEYIIRYLRVPMIFYSANIIFLGIMNLVLWWHITNPKLGLTEGVSAKERTYFSIRAFIVPVIFLVMCLSYIFVSPKYAIYVPMIIPVLMRLFRKFFLNKYKSV